MSPSLLARCLLAAGAAAGLCQSYAIPFRWNRGPEGRWWESVRRRISRLAGRLDAQAGPRPIAASEYAGSLDLSLHETEALLWADGFIRNPIARLKVRSGTPVAGSWVSRESPLAPLQLHLMLFEGEDGTDVYAHQELSSVNPLCAADHFTGQGQSVAAGVSRARELLPLDSSHAPENPPDGPWNSTS
ncbi:hypothetical protein [Halobacteriaceae bacterium SHR40]|uniref:hypothetical protein n=1 Tax=Halovenus amylolytica TaxID=2500550 RepID=UPI000FE384D5